MQPNKRQHQQNGISGSGSFGSFGELSELSELLELTSSEKRGTTARRVVKWLCELFDGLPELQGVL
jgi:hypothetical protein